MIVLITSAAYINAEMAAEFGKLPPCMLPLGTRRLIHHQIAAVAGLGGRIMLSLPASYELDALDLAHLTQAGVGLIRVPENLSLGQSILHCLSRPDMTGPLAILHGDTLLTPPPRADAANSCLVARSPGRYSWGRAFVRDGLLLGAMAQDVLPRAAMPEPATVLVGYFTMRDAAAFRDALLCGNADFLTALSRLALNEPVAAIDCAAWSDFGHLQTYYRSRAGFAAVRSFNSLAIAGATLRKTSADAAKVAAEARWFQALPAHLLPYAARLVDAGALPDGGFQYSTEYEYLPTLQELFVFGRLSPEAWDEIFAACCRCLEDFASTDAGAGGEDALLRLAREKTMLRLDEFECQSGLDLARPARLNGRPLPSPRRIAEQMVSIVRAAPPHPAAVMHGDFCFSNILFNTRTQRVRLIDPRGTIDGNVCTIAGDFRYDMAKLAHSVLGLYDLVIAGRFACRSQGGLDFELSFPEQRNYAEIAARLTSLQVQGCGFQDPVVVAVMILLFFAMLPLHADRPERQQAFLANALRLYDLHHGDAA